MKESEIQKYICKMLAKSPDVAFYIVNTTGLFKRNGCKYSVGKWVRRDVKDENHSGLSDITGMTIDGKWFSTEVKRPGREPTNEQWEHINFVNGNGGLAGFATNVMEAEKIIRGFEIKL